MDMVGSRYVVVLISIYSFDIPRQLVVICYQAIATSREMHVSLHIYCIYGPDSTVVSIATKLSMLDIGREKELNLQNHQIE